MMKVRSWLMLWLASGALWFNAAQATVVQSTQVAAETSALAAQLPAAESFTVTSAGTYTLTLTDFSSQLNNGTAFKSLSVVIYQGAQLIKLLVLPADSSGAITAATASVNVTLAAGSYQAQVLGVTSGGSQYSASLSTAANATLWSSTGAITPTVTQNNTTVMKTLNVVAGQTYTVTLTDRVFPAAFSLLGLIVSDSDNATLGNCYLLAAGSCTFTATGTTALLTVLAQTGSNGKGLYSVEVAGAAGDVYAATLPVGSLSVTKSLSLPAAAAYTLSTYDFATPKTLASFKTALVQGANVATLNTAGSTTFTASAGSADLYVLANAASGSSGLYSTQILNGNSVVYESVVAVNSSSNSNVASYVFTPALATAGSYVIKLTDFVLPERFSSVQWSVIQGTTTLGQLSGAGTLTVQPQAGDIRIVVLATAGSTTGLGLFGVTVGDSAGNSIYSRTQGVGASFLSTTVTLSAGHYQLALNDFSAPAAMSNLMVSVTHGADVVGSIYAGGGSGQIPFDVSAGDYALNIVALPKTGSGYGMFGISLTAADNCAASGALFDSSSSAGLALICTTVADTTQTAGTVTSTGKKGGGEFEWPALLLLGMVAGVRRRY